MKKLIIAGLVCSLSAPAFAEKTCSVKLITKTYLDQVSNQEVAAIVTQLASPTDIEIVSAGESDYSLEIYASETYDVHDLRSAYINGDISIWPSDRIQDRSEVESRMHTGFMKKRKLTKKFEVNFLTEKLKSKLKSCEDLENLVRSTGNGTLSPVEGQIYTTKVGATFKRVGTDWMAPNGLLWGEVLDDEYQNAGVDSAAVKACEALGARLPTVDEYRNLMTYFSPSKNDVNRVLSAEGQFEFNSLFPWSFGFAATATRGENGAGNVFHHETGNLGQAFPHWEINVRCVK